MSPEEKALREHLEHMPTALRLLGELLEARKSSALDDAMEFFTKKQKELDRQRTAAKSLSNAEIADLKTEAGRCGWAAQQLRMEQGRRKKGKEKTG